MKEELLKVEQLTLLSERSSAHRITGHSLQVPHNLASAKRKPSQKALEVLADKSSMLPDKNGGIVSWFLSVYSNFPILNPEKRGVLLWNILNYIIIIFYLLQAGLVIGWGDRFWQDEIQYFYYGNIFFLVFFLTDMLICPLKAYYFNGILVESRIKIFKRYTGLYLWFDLLAFMGVLVPNVSLNVTSNYFKILFGFKVITAYNLDKYLLMMVRNHFKRSHIYAMGRIVFFMLFWSHWLGVIFFAVDYMVYQSNYYGPNTPNYCWIFNSALGAGHNLTHLHWTMQYLYSLYYSVGNITTIAYGDITARNPASAAYTIINMSVSILLFTFYFKSMIEVIFLAQADDIQNTNNINLIRRYLKNNQVTNLLQTKIRSYFETNWEEQKFRNRDIEIDFISKLPKELKEKLNVCLFGEFIADLGLLVHPEFFNHSANKTPFLFQLSNSFEFQRITAGQILYNEGESIEEHQNVYYCDNMYSNLAITLGQGRISEEALKISAVDNLTEAEINRIHLSSMKIANICGIFGETSFYSRNRRDHWAISNKNVEILKLARDKLDQLLESHGSDVQKERFFMTYERIESRICYICREQGHRFAHCPYVTYVPEFTALVKKLKVTNERLNNSRIVKAREGQKVRTARYNCWKTYSKQRQEFLIYNSQRYSWSHEESEGEDSFRQDFMDELILLKTIVKTHLAEHPKVQKQSLHSAFDVDEGYLFKLYQVNRNYDCEIVRCNQLMKKNRGQHKHKIN